MPRVEFTSTMDLKTPTELTERMNGSKVRVIRHASTGGYVFLRRPCRQVKDPVKCTLWARSRVCTVRETPLPINPS